MQKSWKPISAALSNASRIEIRDHDLRVEHVTRTQLVTGLASMGVASTAAARDSILCYRELSRLLAAPRIVPRTRASGSALYLNANLWFGVKAGGSLGHVAGVANALIEAVGDVVYASAGGRTMIRPEIPLVALTPPDVLSQMSLAIPLLLLYEGSIWSVKFVEGKAKPPGAAGAAGSGDAGSKPKA